MGGVYDIPAVFMAVRGVMTNTVPIDAYRGAGKPEANYLIERLVDSAARQLAFDPVALRRRNLINHFPYRSGLGVTIDCGRSEANLDEMAQRLLRDGFAARRQEAAARGRLRGLGIACFLETSRGTPGERAEIRFEPDGRVALVLGTQSNGQGHEPALRKSPPTCWGCRLQRSVLSRPTREWSRPATGTAVRARCIWVAARSTWRRRWCCPRRARLPPTCCRPTRVR
jgi:CO/xanthine dehydrogenase Mo-binding subunit